MTVMNQLGSPQLTIVSIPYRRNDRGFMNIITYFIIMFQFLIGAMTVHEHRRNRDQTTGRFNSL